MTPRFYDSIPVDYDTTGLRAEDAMTEFVFDMDDGTPGGITIIAAKIGLATLNRAQLVKVFGIDEVYRIEGAPWLRDMLEDHVDMAPRRWAGLVA